MVVVSPEEAILHFARKLTKTPAHLSKEEVDAPQASVGAISALDALWHVSWCNFMVRVSNAFQIPLEPENVFWNLHGKRPPTVSNESTE